ncbi:hypothetical protein [Mycolicibacterium canariasense]|nr:hypothetical protein [Mycolicibacterium canariasense]MCV7209818.1 hypothetical protein [Mycolicibacterium canariasense]
MHSNDLFSHPDRPEVTGDVGNDDVTTLTFSDRPTAPRKCHPAVGTA